MPAPTYPAIPLPNANVGTRTEMPVLRTAMESGLVRQVPRFSTGRREWNVSWTLTAEEYDTFKDFFLTDLANGTKFFDITLVTEAGTETVSARFVDGTFTDRYRPHGTWDVAAVLEEEIVQTLEEPTTDPVPAWYRPEVLLIGDIEADPTIHRNALFKASPAGEQFVITVPEVATLADVLPIGVRLDGTGSVLIQTADNDGGEEPPPVLPDWKAIGVSLAPKALYDWSGATVTGGVVTGCADSSGNNKTITHVDGGTRPGGTLAGDCLTFAGAQCFRDYTTTFGITDAREFHLFLVYQLWSPGRNANSKVNQNLWGGAVNTYGRPSFYVKNSDYVANTWELEQSNGNDVYNGTKPAYMLMKDVLQVLEIRVMKNGSNYGQAVYLDGVHLGTYTAGVTDATGPRIIHGLLHLNGTPSGQYFKLRMTAIFDPNALTLGQATTFRDALLANFATVDAYA